jgi:site-specific DNA recombinase
LGLPRQQARAPAQVDEARAGGSPVRAFGYVRVSTQGQADRGMSLEAQRERIEDYAREKGLHLVGIAEEAASGAVREGEALSYEHRPVLLGLMEAAERREYDVLLVAKLDRLSRDYPTLAILERRLERYDVQVISTAEENGDGPLAEYIRAQLALVAQLERALILERVSAGKAKKKVLGRHVHGRVAFAYESTDGVLRPVPELAPVVERIFRDVQAGDSPGRIARGLNRDAVPSPGGKGWTAKAVQRIATNSVYAGQRYGVKNAHPAIVSRRLFNAAQRALAQRSRHRDEQA